MLKEIEKRKEEELSKALSLLFTDGQRKIIYKKLNGIKLKESERVTYSKIIKPILKASLAIRDLTLVLK